MRHTLLAVLLVSLMAVSADSHAVWNWMRGAVLNEFTDADWDILKSTARDTLDNVADGEQINWRNEDTGNKGAMKALMTFSYQDATCRRMAFLNVNRQGERGVVHSNMCRQDDGTWKFISDSEVTGQS